MPNAANASAVGVEFHGEVRLQRCWNTVDGYWWPALVITREKLVTSATMAHLHLLEDGAAGRDDQFVAMDQDDGLEAVVRHGSGETTPKSTVLSMTDSKSLSGTLRYVLPDVRILLLEVGKHVGRTCRQVPSLAPTMISPRGTRSISAIATSMALRASSVSSRLHNACQPR